MNAKAFYCRAALSLAFWLFLTTASAFAKGGVGVGNGRVVYQSPIGFSVEYREELTLDVGSESAFEISNQQLVKEAEEISRVSFQRLESRVSNLGQLEAWLKEKYPEKTFVGITFSGAGGFYWEQATGGRKCAEYFVFTENGALIQISLDAYESAKGLELVAPIVRTFTYDVTPPDVFQIMALGDVWRTGKKQSIRMKIKDGNSGVNIGGTTFFLQRHEGNDRAEEHLYLDSREGSWVYEGGDWYRFDFVLPRYLMPGRYLLKFTAGDRAYNGRAFYADNPKDVAIGFYKTGMDQKITNLPLVWANIQNDGLVDVSPPLVSAVRADEGDWIAGETRKVYLQLKDAGTGVDLNKLSCRGLQSIPYVAGSAHHSSECGNPRSLGENWYSLDIKVGRYLPDGEYTVVGFNFTDRAGNGDILSDPIKDGPNYEGRTQPADIPLLRVRVRNFTGADVTPPHVFEWKLESHVWRVGTKQTLRFRARDDLAGIFVNSAGLHGWFNPVEKAERARVIYLDQSVVSEGDDWYRMDFYVSPFIQGGEFVMDHFSVNDLAGNSNALSCSRSDGEWCISENGPKLPILRVRVER